MVVCVIVGSLADTGTTIRQAIPTTHSVCNNVLISFPFFIVKSSKFPEGL